MNEILNGEQVNRVSVVAAARLATVVILVAIAALAITSLIPGNKRAAAQSGVEPPQTTAPLPRVSTPAGSFAFGYIEFDWDPSAPGGVPGFDSWPPASQR
jgi:hypothetical protein